MNQGIEDILDPDNSWHEKIEKFLAAYQSLYSLPKIENREEISTSFFNYCLKGRYFAVIVLYNNERNFFVQRDFSKQDEHWELVGGWIEKGEMFDSALDRIVKKETGNTLVDAVPIALVNNYFSTKQGKQFCHSGVAFLGRLRHDFVDSQNGVFTKDENISLNTRDLKIFNLGKSILSQKIIEPPLDEVDSNNHIGIAEYFHRYFIKPIFYYVSSMLLQNIVFRNALFSGSAPAKTFIDVACGDDETILKLSKNAEVVVANDISRNSMAGLIKKSDANNIIFTNQNLLELNIEKKFDVVICKNVMHHMKNADEIKLLFTVLKKLGKRIIIMDIENPRKTFLARMWNNYYVKILNDSGGFFIDFNQFRSIIELFYKGSEMKFSIIKTIKGRYMLAVIDQ